MSSGLLRALVISTLLHLALVVEVMVPFGGSSLVSGHIKPLQPIHAALRSAVAEKTIAATVSVSEEVLVAADAGLSELAERSAESQLQKEAPAEKSVERVSASGASHESGETESIDATKEPPVELSVVQGYLSGKALSRQPRLKSEISVEYPATAGGREGRVLLQIMVSANGTVDHEDIIRADPPDVFDQVVLAAFSRAEFFPGEVLGLPVKSIFSVEIEFFPLTRGNVSGRGY